MREKYSNVGQRPMFSATAFLGASLAMGLISGTVHAQMFKCAEATGAITFSDKPCAASTSQSVVDLRYKRDVRPPAIAPSASAPVAAAPVAPASTPIALSEQTAAGPTLSIIGPSKSAGVVSADRLAELCVDQYRPHLAYPNGVRILSRSLERRLDEMVITVEVRTITNNATPYSLGITLDERFVCVTDGGQGLNMRSTGMWVARHKKGNRL